MTAGAGSYLLCGAVERRRHQRLYVALVSPRRFCVTLADIAGGTDLPVYDLSLGGFSCARPTEIPVERFRFALQMQGEHEPITGEAQVRSLISNGGIGCEIVAIADAERERLTGWLVNYVLTNARMPLKEEEARAIVTGNSFL